MNTSTTLHWKHLAQNPNSCYRQLFIKGTRIRARVLYGMHVSAEQPMSVLEIAAEFNLPVDAVEEAITYCKGNPPEIAEDFERENKLMEASGMNDPNYKYGGKFKIVPAEEVARILKP